MKSITTKPRFAITHRDAGPLLLTLIPGWAPMRACIWALAVVLALWWTTAHIRRTVKDMARIGARSCFEKDLLYRQGADMKGGVYVPTTGKTPLNRYLVHLPDRDITTRSGHPLTLMNPAYMIRQVHELGKELYEHRDHITSLKPIRPENDPVARERKALEAFERGAAEVSSVELIEGQPHLRLMQPTKTMARCLKCYSVQGYQEGDIPGGIRAVVPMKDDEAIFHFYQREELRAQSGIGGLALLSLGAGHWKIRRRRRELDQAQAALRESEQRYRTLVEDSFDGIFLQKGTKIIFANKPLHEMLGYEPGELIGKDHWIIYHPEDQPMTRARAQARLRGESVIDHYEVRLQSKEGTVLDGEIRAKAFSFEEEPGIQVWVRDISEQKRSKEKFQTLVENVPFGTMIIKEDGTFGYCSPQVFDMFGYSPEDVPDGSTWMRKAYPDPDYRREVIATWIRDMREARPGVQTGHESSRSRAKTGPRKHVRFRPVQLRTGEHLMTLEDITDRKRAEEELQRLNRALRTLSECNQALVRAPDEATLVADLCRILVEQGGYRMAWIGFAEQDEAKTVRPVAQAGFEEGYLNTVNITWADTERGRGPTGTAIRTGQPVIARNIPADPAFDPWREAAVQRGYASSVALPLKRDDRVFGALNVSMQRSRPPSTLRK